MTLRRMLTALRLFRQMDEVIPASTVEVFLVIADRDEGVTRQDIMDLCGLDHSSAWRNLMILTRDHKQNGRNRRGLGLLEERPDPEEVRRLLWKLTPQGRRLREQLRTILGG